MPRSKIVRLKFIDTVLGIYYRNICLNGNARIVAIHSLSGAHTRSAASSSRQWDEGLTPSRGVRCPVAACSEAKMSPGESWKALRCAMARNGAWRHASYSDFNQQAVITSKRGILDKKTIRHVFI